jgi:flagellar hook-basal body complex protein FliE
MTNISDVAKVYANALKATTGTGESTPAGASFGDMVKEKLEQTIDAQYKSEQISAKAVVGQADMTDVLQAMTDAEVALNTVLAVRNRVVSAYQEIMRTAI